MYGFLYFFEQGKQDYLLLSKSTIMRSIIKRYVPNRLPGMRLIRNRPTMCNIPDSIVLYPESPEDDPVQKPFSVSILSTRYS